MSGPEARLARSRRWLGRRRWDVERFGLTPGGIRDRIRPRSTPRVLAISIPKSGTHLLERALCLHPRIHRRLTRKVMPAQLDRLDRVLGHQRPGELVCGHIHHSARAAAIVARDDTEVIFVVRHPRDIVVSQAHYVYTHTAHQWHRQIADKPALRDRVAYFIRGDQAAGIASIGGVLDLYLGWLDAGCRLTRFEDLVDPEARRPALASLYGDLGLDADDELIAAVAGQLVSPLSVTFRRGRSGEWADVFDDELRAEFDLYVGGRLTRLGYE